MNRATGPAPATMPRDTELGGLAEALDGEAVRGHLRDGGLDVVSVTAAIVRHHVGDRCTIRYDVSLGGCGECGQRETTTTLFAKVLRRDSERIATVARALADASARDRHLPVMMPVVASVPSIGLVVFEACAPADPFHERVFGQALDDATRRSWWTELGRSIAALHHGDVPGLASRSAAEDLRAIQRALDAAEAAVGPRGPERHVIERARALLDEVEARLAAIGATSRRGPTHGALRTDQVLRRGARFALVDLDSAGIGPIALDLGNLFAYLTWRAVRGASEPATIDAAAAAFTSGYEQVAPTPSAGEVGLWQASSMVKIAARRLRGGPAVEVPLVPALLDAAAALIA